MWLILVSLIVVLVILTTNWKNDSPKPYSDQIEEHTLRNLNYRKVLSTTNQLQLVLMSLKPNEDIGEETHSDVSQFIRVEKGQGLAVVDGQQYPMNDGNIIVIPAKSKHNIINLSSSNRLQLYSIYSPPEHPPGTLQRNKPTTH